MEKKQNILEINVHDKLALGDGMAKKKRINDPEDVVIDKKRPAGVVQIYEIDKITGNRKLVHKNNLVLYAGREWIASRLTGITNPLIPSGATKDEYIRWAALGSGGTGNPLDPDSPTNEDDDLFVEVPLNDTGGIGYTDYRGGDYYKKIIDSDDVIFEPDIPNASRLLAIKVSFQILSDDAVGQNVNEAGLYTAEDNNGPWHIFARVTFPTIVKTVGRDLLFVWYVYC